MCPPEAIRQASGNPGDSAGLSGSVQEPGSVEVSLEVVHPDERYIQRISQGLGRVQPGYQRPGQPRTIGHRHGIDRLQVRTSSLERLFQGRHHVPDVLPGSHLRHDSPVAGMKLHLGSDDVGTQDPAVLHHSDRGLVTGCFNAKDFHAAISRNTECTGAAAANGQPGAV